ncbi:hypothetical protein [Bradyrhizobium sp. RP6]|uniref:hypothetical protein n=1 Tax=Bradyrhizobium sp. RP6 TaxID=2489596 RepID=UPI000F531234|nr:hypothetical protein [Bradyrhizobium sp. RP6]RQH11522.1 hypothetical protein EHH60_20035 [Bradyrhizobium sp. RP6]
MGEIWRRCCRGVLLLTGIVGVTWSLIVLPSFWADLQVSSVATHILVGEQLKPGTVDSIAVRMDADSPSSLPYPNLIRARALIALRSAEEAMLGKGSQDLDRKLAAAENKLKSSLMLDPADAFLWLLLYWVRNERDGFDAGNIRYLEQSYAAGPYEGWIALRRNRLALAVFPLLGEQLQQKVVAEFAGMVESEFTDDAARNLTGVGWPQRDRLLASLAGVRLIAREAFAKRLAYDGVKATVPGVDLPERMWRQ